LIIDTLLTPLSALRCFIHDDILCRRRHFRLPLYYAAHAPLFAFDAIISLTIVKIVCHTLPLPIFADAI